jgi:kumamolisin
MPGGKIERIGSSRDAPEGAAAAGAIDPNERITITVHLKRRSPDKFAPGSAGDLARLRAPITRETLAAQRARTHGRAAARITRFAKANGLSVRETDIIRRRVVLEGTAQQMTELFGVALAMYDDGQRQFRARTGPLFVPAEIAPWTRAILGFDQRPLVRRLQDLAGAGQGDGLLPTEIAALYGSTDFASAATSPPSASASSRSAAAICKPISKLPLPRWSARPPPWSINR